jgi:ligand-binding sensor domain-containing protein
LFLLRSLLSLAILAKIRAMFQKCAHASVAALQRGTVFLLLTAASFGAFGSTNSIARYSVRIWQSDDGLPHNSVWAVTQGAHGYLWVGTQQGLVRFDGLRFVALDESAPAELRRGWITALCVAPDESLWIGCEGYGLARMKAGSFTHFGVAEFAHQYTCAIPRRRSLDWDRGRTHPV